MCQLCPVACRLPSASPSTCAPGIGLSALYLVISFYKALFWTMVDLPASHAQGHSFLAVMFPQPVVGKAPRSLPADGEVNGKIKLEIMCWFSDEFFWALLKLWCPHAVEQRHGISAGGWVWSHRCSHRCCYSHGNPSDQPETLEKRTQCSWWLVLHTAEIWFLTNQGDLQTCILLTPVVFGVVLGLLGCDFADQQWSAKNHLTSRNLLVPALLLTCVGSRVRLHNGTFSLFKVRKLCTEAVKRM